MIDLPILVQACGAQISFFDPMGLVEFARMLAHQIPPEQFVEFVRATVPSADAVDEARKLATMCMGTPS